MSTARHAAILLAAGASRRLGEPKALLTIAGETLLHRTARCLLATAPERLIVVTGAPDLAARLVAALEGLQHTRIACDDWSEGMAATLRAGVRAATNLRVDGVLVCPCDLPALDPAHLQALIACWRRRPELAVCSRYDGVLGAPAVLPRRAFATLAQLTGDRGARDWLRAQSDALAIDAPALAQDLDTPADRRYLQ